MIICKMNEMVQCCNGDITYGEKIRTHWNKSSSTNKGKQFENNPCYYLWISCEHFHVPLVLYLPFPRGCSFSKLHLQLIMLWPILPYFFYSPFYFFPPFLWKFLFICGCCHNFLVHITANFKITCLRKNKNGQWWNGLTESNNISQPS